MLREKVFSLWASFSTGHYREEKVDKKFTAGEKVSLPSPKQPCDQIKPAPVVVYDLCQ